MMWQNDFQPCFQPCFVLGEDGKTPVPCQDEIAFALWMAEHEGNLHVADTYLELKGDLVRVSTVFLGHNHAILNDVPALFETMVFWSQKEQQHRYHTWEEAEAGHQRSVEFFEACGYVSRDR